MKLEDDLVFNIVQDWKKREISAEQKQKFIKAILEERDISQRKLAEELGVSHSTLHDWVSNRQMKKYYTTKRYELEYLLDRLTFLLSRPFEPTPKVIRGMRSVKSELEKLELMPV